MKALAGIRVIDFSKWLPGQYCGMVLGDFGADVIKVETPAGDATRGFFPAALPGMSYWHLALNRNKRGITADIRTEGGRKLLQQLLAEADVFLEGFRPGYLERYGLDCAAVKAINPRLVYCSITGFGQNGAYRHKPAHDLNVIGLAGLNSLDDVGSACVSEVQVSALGSSLNAVSGILLALLARERTGTGQAVDINLYNTSLSLQTTGISSLWGCKATGCQPFGRTAHYYNIYRTQDGRYLSVGTIEPKFWRRLCGLLGCEDLIARQYDFEHGGELQERLAAVFQTKTQADWLALIGAEEFCVTPVCSLEEALSSELTQQSAMLTQRQEDIGTLQYVQPAIRLSEMPGSIERRAPLLGEHTAEVLAELGYSEAEIMRLQETGAI
ncbi:CaiB/BaiF CoA-transferase family protein [uncultured Phascolarctobacterium sp.]|uniref:CaiB/BaiF CoA transferase family protein n=3 Tax=uncultured Phascolarctobacterium sp. TaxID=512296 RepID=UPI00265D44C9|nr:CoA transferase [uncultured Phascolarctobacterium sp.]